MRPGRYAMPILTASPFALVLCVTLGVRRSREAHEHPEYTPAQTARLEAYRPLIRDKRLLEVGRSLASAGPSVRAYGREWASRSASVGLRPLTPVCTEELTESGPRSEVVTTWNELQNRLSLLCARDVRAGRYAAAADDLSLLLETSSSMRYSDLETAHLADSSFLQVAGALKGRFERLPAAMKPRLRAELEAFAAGGAGLDGLRGAMTALLDDFCRRVAAFQAKLGGTPEARVEAETGAFDGDDGAQDEWSLAQIRTGCDGAARLDAAAATAALGVARIEPRLREPRRPAKVATGPAAPSRSL